MGAVMIDFVHIDVSDLPPPEPMTAILQSLAQLAPEQCLQVKHNRQPFPLYEKLAQANWQFHCQQIEANQIVLYIFKPCIQQVMDKFILKQCQSKE